MALLETAEQDILQNEPIIVSHEEERVPSAMKLSLKRPATQANQSRNNNFMTASRFSVPNVRTNNKL